MGRELREVPLDWQHPKDTRGNYIPMYNRTYQTAVKEYQEDGENPADLDPAWYRPEWAVDAVMGYCVYEDVSEGTPISPVFETKELVIDWLVGQGYDVRAASEFVRLGWSPSFVMQHTSHGTRFSDGIEALGWMDSPTAQK